MAQPHQRSWGTREFLAWEGRQEYRYELVGGEPRMMTGGTRAHNQIAGSIYTHLRTALRGSRCQASIADMKILLPNGDVRYPDVAVDCAPGDRRDIALIEPTVVVEVLSPSTAWYDQTQKLDDYRAIPSLRRYLLVRQDRPQVEAWSRDGERWTREVLTGLAAAVPLPAIGAALPLADIYDGLGYEDAA